MPTAPVKLVSETDLEAGKFAVAATLEIALLIRVKSVSGDGVVPAPASSEGVAQAQPTAPTASRALTCAESNGTKKALHCSVCGHSLYSNNHTGRCSNKQACRKRTRERKAGTPA